MKKIINKLEQNLGIKVNNTRLYIDALTHKSADKTNNYEKLEFLGDRVLGLCISKKLLEIFPNEKSMWNRIVLIFAAAFVTTARLKDNSNRSKIIISSPPL